MTLIRNMSFVLSLHLLLKNDKLDVCAFLRIMPKKGKKQENKTNTAYSNRAKNFINKQLPWLQQFFLLFAYIQNVNANWSTILTAIKWINRNGQNWKLNRRISFGSVIPIGMWFFADLSETNSKMRQWKLNVNIHTFKWVARRQQ